MNLTDVVNAVLGIGSTTIVSCPLEPVEVPGIPASNLDYDAGDAFGTVIRVRVPKRGVLLSGSFFDLDDEGTDVYFHIYKLELDIAPTVDSDYDIADGDALKWVHTLHFYTFRDFASNQVSEATNIGKAYTSPDGMFYLYGEIGTTAQTFAIFPRIQLQIQSFDPDFKER